MPVDDDDLLDPRVFVTPRRMTTASTSRLSDGERVIIGDIDIPFWRMVWFLVKLALAAIPAGIILALIGWLFWMAVVAMFAPLSQVRLF